MENFVVSARKYRPVTFESVVGQEHITTTLKNAVATQHLAQAFLFCGPRGVGKTTCARILAKTINCQNLGPNTEPCGSCESCNSFQNNASFNIHELDAASNNSVEDIRSLIDQVRYPPSSGKYKIYIIDEVHMLSSAAFNAFLKTLEEPPAYAIFILATTEKHKILPTILSRCQNFDFNRIKVADMAAHLQKIADSEGVKAEPLALELIAQKADGGLRDALSMFDLLVTYSANNELNYLQAIENLHILDYDYYFQIATQLTNGEQAQAFSTFDQILKKGFDAHLFLVGLLEHFRNLLFCKDAVTAPLLEVSESIQQKYVAQAQATNYSFLLSALSIGSQCDIHYKAAKNQRLHVEICLLKMANLKHLLNLDSLQADEKKNSDNLASAAKEIQNTAGASPKVADTIQPTAVQATNKSPETQPVAAKPTSESLVKAATETLAPKGPGVLTKSSLLKSTKIQIESKTTPLASPEPEATATTASDSPQAAATLSADAIKPVWERFLTLLDEQDRHNDVVLLRRDITVDGNIILLNVEAELQKNMIAEKTQEELTQYLRQSLGNTKIRLQIDVVEEQQERKTIYTQAEKYKHLLEQNPELQYMKTELGLDYEF
jgi:DNA polymerase III subunit gamma/tau